MNKTTQKCYIGVDISKTNLDVWVSPYKKYMQFKNTPQGINQLCKKINAFKIQPIVVLEATGGYERSLACALALEQVHVTIINPKRVKDFARASGINAKTDLIDAQIIALFAEKIEPKANVAYDEQQQKIQFNNTRRRQLINMITQEKNHLKQAPTKDLKRSIERIITTLEKELKAIQNAQLQAIERNEKFSQIQQQLTSIKGVGNTTAHTIIADLPELGNIGRRQISALAGLAPFNRDSGALKGKRMIFGGRASVRSALYMATLSAMRHNPQIKQFYEHLCSKGKAKKVAMVACMRKLLIIMNTMIKNNQYWQYAATVET